MNLSQRIYDHAQKDMGLHEKAGPSSHPRIAHAIRVAADWLNDDDSKTAWCGCIRGLWGLETGTGVPAAHYRAASWLNWGTPVDLTEAIQGDTVVLKRNGGHHVGLLEDFTSDMRTVYLLGGNQSDAVNISGYDATRIVGVRRAAAKI